MESKIKLLMLFVVAIFLVSTVSALDVLKPAKVNTNYTVVQTCSSCTYVNITISNVNGIIVDNQAMVSNGSGTWIYGIVPTAISRHDVTGQGDVDGTATSFATYFEVTPSGNISTTGDSILYALFSFVFFLAIIIISIFVFAMPGKNEKHPVSGHDTRIVKIKYLRVVLITFLYALIILLLNFLTGLAVNFDALTIFAGILGFLFESLLRLTWVFAFLMITWIAIMLIHDTNVKKQLRKFGRMNFHGRG